MDLVDVFLKILTAHHLSQRAVCDIIGFTSANQMTRILKRQVSHKYLVKFSNLLLEHKEELELTDTELAELQACCMSLNLSTDDETAASLFFSTISRPITPDPDADLTLYDAAGLPLGSLQTIVSGAECLSFTVIGCLNLPLCDILLSLETRHTLSVDYYHAEGKQSSLSAQYLRCIWPYLHKPWFHPYCVKRTRNAASDGLCNADAAFFDVHYAAGKLKSFMLVPKSAGAAFLFPFPKDHLPFRALLFSREDILYPLEISPEADGNYLSYLRYLQDLERNHRVFLIKADFCLNMIPASIQLRALQEGPMRDYPGIDALLDPMFTIEEERYLNARDKKKHQYYLHTYEGLLHFMQTGMETDHFWGFRPFTPEERLAILTELYERAAGSPYTHLLLLKPGITLIPDEIGWYEDRGICFLLPQTHYHIENEHSELLFQDPAFCQFFSGYFRKWICRHYAFSEAESLRLLWGLLKQFSKTNVPPPDNFS